MGRKQNSSFVSATCPRYMMALHKVMAVKKVNDADLGVVVFFSFLVFVVFKALFNVAWIKYFQMDMEKGLSGVNVVFSALKQKLAFPSLSTFMLQGEQR